MPFTGTVVYSDAENGGGCTVTISGADALYTYTVHLARWDGHAGQLTWETLSPALGPGLTAYAQGYTPAGGVGFYFGYVTAVRAGLEFDSTVQNFAITDADVGSNYQDIMDAVRDQIAALALSGSPNIVVRKIGVDMNLGDDKLVEFPAILVVPHMELMPSGAGTNGMDDVTYGVWVMPVDKDNRDTTLVHNLDRHLAWRNTIARHFRNQRLIVGGATLAYKCEVVGADAVIQDAWKANLFAGAQLLKFTCRETRGN